MGSMKDDWIDQQHERSLRKRYENIASHFGLTYEEVEELEPKIDENETNDGGHVGWDITFPDSTPDHIKQKLGGSTHKRVGLGFFDDENESEDDDNDYDGNGPDGPSFIDLPPGAAKAMSDQLRKNENGANTD